MNYDVIISCAVTGDDTKVTKSPHCAITPEQIAAAGNSYTGRYLKKYAANAAR